MRVSLEISEIWKSKNFKYPSLMSSSLLAFILHLHFTGEKKNSNWLTIKNFEIESSVIANRGIADTGLNRTADNADSIYVERVQRADRRKKCHWKIRTFGGKFIICFRETVFTKSYSLLV